MRYLRVRLATAPVAVGTVTLALTGALALTGQPALAAVAAQARSQHVRIIGPEVISGGVTGRAANSNSPHIPLHLRGVVRTIDLGFVLNGGGGRDHAVRTPAGTLWVRRTSRPTSQGTGDPRTCRETFTQDQRFRVLSGRSTGAFAHSSGPGAVQIYFAAFAPRHHRGPKKGQCDFNAQPRNRGAFAHFLATIVLTVRR